MKERITSQEGDQRVSQEIDSDGKRGESFGETPKATGDK
jgi:hypothetical protein